MSLILIALLQFTLLFRNVISTCSTTSDVEFTFYGFPDGPSDTTSFGCSGTTKVADGTAGGSSKPLNLPPSPKAIPFPLTVHHSQGDGSYANPETFATALNNPNFVPCEIVYLPLFQKYFQYMDHCEECMNLYPGTIRIDLWIGSDVNGGQSQIDCEDAFGKKIGQTIVRDPPSTLQVNGGQLWDNDSGTCGDDKFVFPNYSTSEADLCGAGGSPAPSSTSSASTPPTSTPSTPASSSINGAPGTGSGGISSGKDKVDATVANVDTVNKVVEDVKANAPSPSPSPSPTTLATIVSATPSPTTPSSAASVVSSSSSSSSSSSASSSDCGVTAEWPTAWLGHCVGTSCHEFNDCSGELICQGWPNPVCTNPKGGK